MRKRMPTGQPDILRPRPLGTLLSVTLATGAVAVLAACGTGVRGVAGTAPTPNVAWTPPRRSVAPPPQPAPPPELPPDLANRIAQLTLTDVIDIALRNNTATSAAWADARSAAASYGAAKGEYFPTVTADGTAQAIKRIASGGAGSAKQQSFGPSLNVSWLLLDFGGRSGSVGEAREALLAADWTHNATLQTVVLGVQQAYFLYMGTKALLDAQQTTLTEARQNLDAAEQRHRVGLATIADVLQAKTALSQAQLALESTQGDLQTTRGALALSMGLPANVPYDIAVSPDTTVPLGIVESVDTLIAHATRERPDLAAQRALAEQARARVSVARSQALPALSVGGTANQTYFVHNPPTVPPANGNGYTATLTLSIPIFSGWSQIYDVKAASAAADAAALRAQGFEQQVIYQVFNAYYALRTSTQLVRTSRDLLASATESEQVALGRYKAGAGSLLDLLTAQAALASARAQAIQARFSWNTALAQLAHDVGILGLDGTSPLKMQSDTTGTGR
ncbi:MAG TPA: TolC family protein [Gemmatimonadales bacterium]|nr:TolC family protein [Gemmatimonadales bacterium]